MSSDRKLMSPVLSFEKRFAAYALVGSVAVLSVQDVADASIVTGTVNQTVGPSSLNSAGIDFDSDNNVELVFQVTSSALTPASNGFQINMQSGTAMYQNTGSMNNGSFTKPLATVLTGNTLIGPTAPSGSSWGANTPQSGAKSYTGLQDYDQTTGLPIAANGFAGETQKFIGFSVVLTTENVGSSPYPYHYGWVRVSAPSTWGGNFTIHDWAYESQSGVAITTPGGGGTVPEPGTLQVVALGGLGLVAWRRRRLQAAE